MHEKDGKFCFIFTLVSSYISFSIAKCLQTTFCALNPTDSGDVLPVTIARSPGSWSLPGQLSQQLRAASRWLQTHTSGYGALSEDQRRVRCGSFQIFERFGKEIAEKNRKYQIRKYQTQGSHAHTWVYQVSWHCSHNLQLFPKQTTLALPICSVLGVQLQTCI